VPEINNYRKDPELSPEETLAGVSDTDATHSRERRKRLVTKLRDRASGYLKVFDKRERGPSRDEAVKLAQDFEAILSEIRK